MTSETTIAQKNHPTTAHCRTRAGCMIVFTFAFHQGANATNGLTASYLPSTATKGWRLARAGKQDAPLLGKKLCCKGKEPRAPGSSKVAPFSLGQHLNSYDSCYFEFDFAGSNVPIFIS